MHDYEFRPDHDAQFLAPVLPETVAMYWVTSRVPHNSTDVALRYLYLGNFSGCVPIFIIPVNFFLKKSTFRGCYTTFFPPKISLTIFSVVNVQIFMCVLLSAMTHSLLVTCWSPLSLFPQTNSVAQAPSQCGDHALA